MKTAIQNNKPEYINMILAFAAVVFVIASVVALFMLKDEKAQCLKDPVKYGLDEAAKATQSNIMCTCSLLDKSGYPVIVQSNVTIDK